MVSGGSLFGLFVFALFTIAKVSDIAIDLSDQLISFYFEPGAAILVPVTFINTDTDVVKNLLDRASRHSAKLDALLIVPPSVSFRNVVGHRDNCFSHLRI